jgi:hypothetical protein
MLEQPVFSWGVLYNQILYKLNKIQIIICMILTRMLITRPRIEWGGMANLVKTILEIVFVPFAMP